jgi:hypothetical protein
MIVRARPTAWPIARDRNIAALLACVVVAAAVRTLFVAIQVTPVHDPWRQLALIQNLRRGSGFTLFDGQPYTWYTPLWHQICAMLPSSIDPAWTAALLSTLAVPAFYGWLRRVETDAGVWTARAGMILAATFGPVVAFTCHYAQEALALFLTTVGLLSVAMSARSAAALGGGVLLGLSVVVRLNFAFNVLLALASLRGRRQGAALALGVALPISVAWWRNHRIIQAFPYVFTWDGLAARSADFGLLSTLVIPMHPAVGEALRRLHRIIAPTPEWAHSELLLFMICAAACVLASRRWYVFLPGALGLTYLGLFDRTLSSNFFRMYLGLFPVLLAAIAVVAGQLRALRSRWAPAAAWGLIALTVATGARSLVPPEMVPLDMVTPPPELLAEKAYMVNSGFYQPDALAYRFPEKSFIGMPLDPGQFEDFRKRFPRYRYILWHDFSVQDDLARYLERSGAATVVARGKNAYGRLYAVLRLNGE